MLPGRGLPRPLVLSTPRASCAASSCAQQPASQAPANEQPIKSMTII